SLAVLSPLAFLGTRTVSNYSQLNDLGPDQPSLVGARIAQRYFAVGEIGPTRILLHHPGIDFRSSQGREIIETFSSQLAALPEVAEVRSLSRPLGQPRSAEPPKPATAPAGRSLGGALNAFLRSGERVAADVKRLQIEARYVSITAPG